MIQRAPHNSSTFTNDILPSYITNLARITNVCLLIPYQILAAKHYISDYHRFVLFAYLLTVDNLVLSVKSVICYKMEERSVQIFTSHEDHLA